MAIKVPRGKALVNKLKRQAGVRDPEALAAHLGRKKTQRQKNRALKKPGKPSKPAMKQNEGLDQSSRSLPDAPKKPAAPSKPKKPAAKVSQQAFMERYQANEKFKDENPEAYDRAVEKKLAAGGEPLLTDKEMEVARRETAKESEQQARYEAALLNKMEKAERSEIHRVFKEMGGVRMSSPDLAEEYATIPKNLKSKDGLTGDVAAEYLATHYPEFGIENENDMLNYFLYS